jgi:hypothetical protein
MLLQAGRHLEFVVQEFLAQPMRVAAAGALLRGGVRWTTLRPGGAGTGEQNDEAKYAGHDVFPSSKRRKGAPRPTFRGMRPSCVSIDGRENNSQNAVSVPLTDSLKGGVAFARMQVRAQSSMFRG